MAITNQNREQAAFSSPPGNYKFTVLSVDKGISKGGKSSGCCQYKCRIKLEETGTTCFARLTMSDNENLAAQVDCFLKSTGQIVPVGVAYDFHPEEIEIFECENPGKKCELINLIGLRGHVKIGMAKPQNEGDESRYNEVVVWITNKEKLPPAETHKAHPAYWPEKTDTNPEWD